MPHVTRNPAQMSAKALEVGAVEEEVKVKEGWWRPYRADKWHYFYDGRSLCVKWGFPNNDELLADDGNNNTQDTCAECRRRQAKRMGETSAVR